MSEHVVNLKDLKKYAIEYSDAKIEQDAQADVMKSVVESASEKLGVDKAKFREYAVLYYLKHYDGEKFTKQVEKIDSIEIINSL